MPNGFNARSEVMTESGECGFVEQHTVEEYRTLVSVVEAWSQCAACGGLRPFAETHRIPSIHRG